MVTASASSETAASSGMRVMSTSSAGCASRKLSIGPSVWPPASTFASGEAASIRTASATDAGRA